jgi:hypothetical protein
MMKNNHIGICPQTSGTGRIMRYLKATEEVGLKMVYFPETTKKKSCAAAKGPRPRRDESDLENMSCHDW